MSRHFEQFYRNGFQLPRRLIEGDSNTIKRLKLISGEASQ